MNTTDLHESDIPDVLPWERDAVDALEELMKRRSLKRSDIFPEKSRASEIMNRKRPLTLKMIQRLHFQFGIAADLLVRPYRTPLEKEGN